MAAHAPSRKWIYWTYSTLPSRRPNLLHIPQLVLINTFVTIRGRTFPGPNGTITKHSSRLSKMAADAPSETVSAAPHLMPLTAAVAPHLQLLKVAPQVTADPSTLCCLDVLPSPSIAISSSWTTCCMDKGAFLATKRSPGRTGCGSSVPTQLAEVFVDQLLGDRKNWDMCNRPHIHPATETNEELALLRTVEAAFPAKE